jgi:FeS assembly SUF system protein
MSQGEVDVAQTKERIVEAIKQVYDPEIPVNIYELGLIYGIDVELSGVVSVKMTLTAPSCPSAQEIPVKVQSVAEAVPGVTEARVDVVWDPPWTPEKMSESARLQLGLM